jgi:hypothetical protein
LNLNHSPNIQKTVNSNLKVDRDLINQKQEDNVPSIWQIDMEENQPTLTKEHILKDKFKDHN